MKKTIFLVSLLLMVVTSCKKDTESVTDLMNTIPSSAAGVIVLDMDRLISDTGSKIKDNQIKPSKELEECLSKMSQTHRDDFNILFDGSTGIDPHAAVMFYDSSRAFITCKLYDESKFIEFVEKNAGGKFEEDASGVKVCGTVAVKSGQAWILLSSGRRIDPEGIASYSELKASQSFLVTPMGEKLLTQENDVRGWFLLGTYMDEMFSRSQRLVISMGTGFVFEGAESVRFKVDFEKGELEAEAVVLNDKYKPAKYLLPTDKVDITTLKDMGGTCDAMMAFTINSKLIEKLSKLNTGLGGALFGNLSDTFKNIDGTVGIIANSKENSVNGVVTTKGEISSELKDLISKNLGNVSIDGKLLKFSKGTVSGNLSVSECAEELKGACLGLVSDASAVNGMGYGSTAPAGFKYFVLKFESENDGLEVSFEAKTANSGENALLTFMNSGF